MTATAPDVAALIRRVLRQAQRAGYSPGDPESAALLGLARALAQYDPAEGASLDTYVHNHVRGYLMHDRRDHSGLSRRRYQEIMHALARGEERRGALPLPWEEPVGSLDTKVRSFDGLDGPREGHLRDLIPEPHDRIAPVAERAFLGALLRRLPESQAQAVTLTILEDRTQAEAARLIGCSQMECSRRVRRGLARLRELWNEEE